MLRNSIRINQFLWKSRKSAYSVFRNPCVLPLTKVNTVRYLHLVRDGASNSKRYASLVGSNTRLATDEDIKFSCSVYFQLVKDMLEPFDTGVPGFKSYLERMLCNALPDRTHGVIYATTSSYKMLARPEEYTTDNILKAIIIGWCAEIGIYGLAAMDDILDKSETRHHRLCWYKNPDVGLRAIADILVAESGQYLLLKKYFSHHPCYTFIMELFQENSERTLMGQAIDLSFSEPTNKNMSEVFTMEKYITLCNCKSSCLGDLPLRSAMYLTNIVDEQLHKDVSNILFKLAHLWQVENDVCEYYEGPSVTGKNNNDIRTKKCTWLIVQALRKASPTQMKILEENYGRDSLQCEAAVTHLYGELNLYDDYVLYEENMRKQIIEDISAIRNKSVRKVLERFNSFPIGFGTINKNYDIITN